MIGFKRTHDKVDPNMKPSVPNRLAKLSAAGTATVTGVFALQHQADAAVIYSGVQNLTASVPPGSYQTVHFNVDSLPGNDLRLVMAATVVFNYGAGFLFASSGGSVARGSLLQLKKIAAGNNISNALGGWTNGGVVYENNNGNIVGYWASTEQAFGAFRLAAGGGTYKYGWIRLQWTDTGNDGYLDTLTAIDWAYESTPDAAIQAGDMGAAPEPTRALLALAGAGAAFLRRRRRRN